MTIELRRPRMEAFTPSVEDEFFADAEPEEAMTVECLHNALKALTARQRFVVELRYGIRDGHAYTVRECAELMNVSHSTVVQHEQAAIEKIRKTLPNEVTVRAHQDLPKGCLRLQVD